MWQSELQEDHTSLEALAEEGNQEKDTFFCFEVFALCGWNLKEYC